MEKILTIIIPTYNMEKYIANCCNSLLVSEELLKKLEVLIINDGSKDKSSIIAHDYQKKYSDIFFVIDKENGNYGSCINEGLKIARGKYIKILDSDDTFYTSNFSDYLTLLENTDDDLILSDYDMVDSSGKVFIHDTYPFESNKSLEIDQFSKNIYPYFAMHAVAYKLENLLKLNYKQTEGISYTDQEWIFLPMSNVRTFIYFDKPVYKYLVGRDGQTVNPETHAKNIQMEIKVSEKIIQDYINHRNTIYNKDYIENKLYERCNIIYRFYLINYKKFVNFNDLIDYDNYLKEKLPEVYNKLANKKEIPNFRYIKSWRKHHSNNTFIFKLFYFNRKIYFFVHRIIHKTK